MGLFDKLLGRSDKQPQAGAATAPAAATTRTPAAVPAKPVPATSFKDEVAGLRDLIATSTGLAAHPAPELRFATYAHWAAESDFGRSELARVHRNYAHLRWDESHGAHEKLVELQATKVEIAPAGGARIAYYAFPSLEAFVRGYWRHIILGASTQDWRDHEKNEAGFLQYMAARWRPADTGFAGVVARLAQQIRAEIEPATVIVVKPPETEKPPETGTNPAPTADRVLFARSPSGYRSPDGMLVQILQLSMKHYKLLEGPVTSRYDAATEAAVKRYQQSHRQPIADGRLRYSEWQGLTGLPPPSLFDRCLAITAAFEGTGFQKVCGNFDGAFLTWGIVGFTLKHDLPDFFEQIEREREGTLARAFGDKVGELRRIIKASAGEKESWGNSISIDVGGMRKYGVREDWSQAFARLGSFPEVQEMQIERAKKKYWDTICVRDCKLYSAADELDVALFYETAVQNGGAGRDSIRVPMEGFTATNAGTKGAARRKRWADIIADGSNKIAVEDVRRRRMTFANGEGTVHGDKYRVADWGLDGSPINVAELLEEHATIMPAAFGQDGSAAPIGLETVGTPDTPSIQPGTVKPSFDLSASFVPAIALALAKAGREGIDPTSWGTPATIGLDDILGQNATVLPADWTTWPVDRKSVALLQLVAKAKAIDVGPIDGWWGVMVQWAYEALLALRKGVAPVVTERPDEEPNGARPADWPADKPFDVNPNNWPWDKQSELAEFYGFPGNEPNGQGRKFKVVKVPCPWTLRFPPAWKIPRTVTSIDAHEKVADSLGRVLAAVHKTYGEAELKRLGLDLFGGSLVYRKKRGGSTLSMHSWGIAIDWDPDNNGMKTTRKGGARLARPEYRQWWECWEREGWCGLGRYQDFDWMHVQAAKVRIKEPK